MPFTSHVAAYYSELMLRAMERGSKFATLQELHVKLRAYDPRLVRNNDGRLLRALLTAEGC